MPVAGDPEAVAREIVSREAEKAYKALEEALEAARRLVADAYEKKLYEAEKKVRDEVARAEEQLKSLISIKELELKSRVSEVKTRYVEEAIRRALERIREEKKGAEWYRRFMERVLTLIAEEAGGETMIVRVAPEDRDLAGEIIRSKNLPLRLSDEPAQIVGGAIGESPDGSTKVDYSLDLLVKMEEYRLRGVAAKILFKE